MVAVGGMRVGEARWERQFASRRLLPCAGASSGHTCQAHFCSWPDSRHWSFCEWTAARKGVARGADRVIEALRRGADIVLTSRMSDNSLAIAPLAYALAMNN